MKGDLIERLHGAVANHCGHSSPPVNGRCWTCDSITSAAVSAVAEWMTTQEHGAGAAVMLTWELKQLEQPK